MAKPLTAVAVSKARAKAERREIPDPGCRGLYLVVQPSGVKSWAARYRANRCSVKLTLGPVLIGARAEAADAPQLGAPMSLAAARELCAKVLREAQAGRDPAAERRKQRKHRHAAVSDTLERVCEEHVRRNPHLRSIEQRRDDLVLFTPTLGAQPISEIRRGQFVRVADAIADERGPMRAGRALGSMRTLLNWHASRSDYVNVLTRTGGRAAGGNSRDRVLGDDELKAVVTAAEAEQRKGNPFGGFVLCVLHTAARRSEAAGLRRSELIDGGKNWLIPAARYKSKRDVLIPLSGAAQRIIAAQPVLPGGDFVFSHSGRRAFSDFNNAKHVFDVVAGVNGWRLHDLRRSSRTLLSRAGVSPDIAELCLGHSIGGIRKVYDRHDYEAEKRAAFEALAALIERIVRPSPDVIVPISSAKPARRK